MAHLKLENVGVEFAIYQSSARSLKTAILQSVGGVIGASSDSGRTVVRALHDVNLEIRRGDRVALIGHNGAGKTTLLRTMAGIYRPTRGQLVAEGRRVPLFDVGLGFDSDASGYENIVLRGLLMGVSRREIESKVDSIAAFSGLGKFLELPVRTYSSGMAMRLIFSIATSIDADILLMDEWIAAGDEAFLSQADKRLHELIDRSHILVFASHAVNLLQATCRRAVVLEGGSIVFDGPLEEALQRYSKRAPAPREA